MDKQPIDIIKEKVEKMKDCPTKDKILSDIANKKKNQIVNKDGIRN